MKRFLRELGKTMGKDIAEFYQGYGRAILYWTLTIAIGYLILHGYIVFCLSFGEVTKGWDAIQMIGGVCLFFSEIFLAWWIWDASKKTRERIDEENRETMSALRGDKVPADKYRSPLKRKSYV